MTLAMWNEERVAQLKKLWEEGLSASQIANIIGGVSRNAVIGKVHRLGLAGRVKPTLSSQAAKANKNKTPPQKSSGVVMGNLALKAEAQTQLAPLSNSTSDNVIPMGQRCDILGLRESSCRWPIGDPTKDDFLYCGGRADVGIPYCGFHRKMAYQSVSDRTRAAIRRAG